MKVAVVGASGFVGSAIVSALVGAGHQVLEIRAPRILARRPIEDDLLSDLGSIAPEFRFSAGTDVVVNAAGLAAPGSPESAELTGANALLPAVVVHRAALAGVARAVQISSAAVYGRARIIGDDVPAEPTSAYGRSKLDGELLAQSTARSNGVDLAILRPTSVHGRGRSVTDTLARFARGRLSSVAGSGSQPTPQVLVSDVAECVHHLVTTMTLPPGPVLQPWSGISTEQLLTLLGGRVPIHLPRWLARGLVTTLYAVGRFVGPAGLVGRRLDMLWHGQRQVPGWLDNVSERSSTFEEWDELGSALR